MYNVFITHATLNPDKVDSKRTQTEVAYNLLKMVKGKEEDIVEDMIDNIKIKDDIGNDDNIFGWLILVLILNCSWKQQTPIWCDIIISFHLLLYWGQFFVED